MLLLILVLVRCESSGASDDGAGVRVFCRRVSDAQCEVATAVAQRFRQNQKVVWAGTNETFQMSTHYPRCVRAQPLNPVR